MVVQCQQEVDLMQNSFFRLISFKNEELTWACNCFYQRGKAVLFQSGLMKAVFRPEHTWGSWFDANLWKVWGHGIRNIFFKSLLAAGWGFQMLHNVFQVFLVDSIKLCHITCIDFNWIQLKHIWLHLIRWHSLLPEKFTSRWIIIHLGDDVTENGLSCIYKF